MSSPDSGPGMWAPTMLSVSMVDEDLRSGCRLANSVIRVPATGVAVADIEVHPLRPDVSFETTDAGQLRNCEHSRGDAVVVGNIACASQHVRRRNLGLEHRDGGQRHPRAVGGVTAAHTTGFVVLCSGPGLSSCAIGSLPILAPTSMGGAQ